jgi:NMD protein affecting ribosome stability and mRNA decay
MYSMILSKKKNNTRSNVSSERCGFCGRIVDHDELNDGLCEDCYNKINSDEIIGYRKGE